MNKKQFIAIKNEFFKEKTISGKIDLIELFLNETVNLDFWLITLEGFGLYLFVFSKVFLNGFGSIFFLIIGLTALSMILIFNRKEKIYLSYCDCGGWKE